MKNSPPSYHRPSPAGGLERPEFRLGGLLAPLIEAGYEEDAREVLVLYVEDHTEKMALISKALEEGDLDACADAAHSLVGSTGGIGADGLARSLMDLEKACREADRSAVEAAYSAIETEKDRVLLAAQRFLSAAPADG